MDSPPQSLCTNPINLFQNILVITDLFNLDPQKASLMGQTILVFYHLGKSDTCQEEAKALVEEFGGSRVENSTMTIPGP